MPSIITHEVFADLVANELQDQQLKQDIHTYQSLYHKGSVGPDFLFFNHLYKWEVFLDHQLNHLGQKIHKTHINEFYEVAKNEIQKQKNKEIQKRMTVYLFGHITHWALDKTVHPYIIYRTGHKKHPITPYHHRFEGMIDAIFAEKYKNSTIGDLVKKRSMTLSQEELQAIARIYVPVVQKVYQVPIRVYQIRKCFESWDHMATVFLDPTGWKRRMTTIVDHLFHQPYLLTSHILPETIDRQYDILNEEHSIWFHPCDSTKVSNASFEELIEQAKKVAVLAITTMWKIIYEEDSMANISNIFRDENYMTGLPELEKMNYFDCIYKN